MLQYAEKEAVKSFMKLYACVLGIWHGRLSLGLWAWFFFCLRDALAAPSVEPVIRAIEHRDRSWIIRVEVPAGVVRVVLEACERGNWSAWIPKATTRVSPGESVIELHVDSDASMGMFRVRADTWDPLPAAWYSGTTDFLPEPTSDPGLLRRSLEDAEGAAGGGAPLGRAVVESDIWVLRGDTLHFFNAMRGLQVIGLENPDAPVLRSTFRLPGSGERMYLADDRHAVLLAQDPCREWGTDAEAAVWVIDTGVVPPVEKARLPLKGRLVESRWVGHALYVATETWEPLNDGTGTWRSGTRIASIDFANPDSPVEKRPRWVAGAGNVVSATDRFLFVAVTDYSKPWPWSSDLEVFDITAEDGTVDTWVRIPLSGRIADPFKIDLWEDALRVVTEAVESPESSRFVTVLETYRLTDPRAMSPLPIARLDRLELARGERLFATRFDGNRAYIVTFLRVDPLWIVDLSNPSDIRVAGEVEIPGWSTYMQPMGDRLLTLGLDDARGSRVALQLFDVSSPTDPFLIAKVPLGEDSSWSEAHHDEKALGLFKDEGLLVVPVSEWKGDRSVQGVQLLDIGRETLTLRGLLSSESVVPRRTLLHRERLVAVSGRELVTADIADRDTPQAKRSLELAYPVERVLARGNHLVEVGSGWARVRPSDGSDPGKKFSLGDLPVLGAVQHDGRMHLLQGRPMRVGWDWDPVNESWVGYTNAGVLQATTWDVSALPQMLKLGESMLATDAQSLSEAQAVWPNPHLLVWALTSAGPRFSLLEGSALDRAGMGWEREVAWRRPWWGEVRRRLVVVEVSATGVPTVLTDSLTSSDEAVGNVFAERNLVFMTHRETESEITGTNWVVESAWFPGPPILETHVVQELDGAGKTNVIVRNDGEWRSVTNAYPTLRWWHRHHLDVWDFSGRSRDPIHRTRVSVPGALEGISSGGALLTMAAWKTDPADGARVAWLDACVYDGVSVRLLDSLRIADERRSETYAVTSQGGMAYVARGGWGTDSSRQVESWRIGESGHWLRASRVDLGLLPEELRVFGDSLAARGGGAVAVVPISEDGGLSEVIRSSVPICFSGELGTGDGDSARGIWLPMWDYGSVRVGR